MLDLFYSIDAIKNVITNHEHWHTWLEKYVGYGMLNIQ